MKYPRILIKVSGEALMGKNDYGHDYDTMTRICEDIKNVVDKGHQVCLVVGGGNIYRGINAEKLGIERVSGDHMGMLATVINALALQSRLESLGVYTRVQSAIPMTTVCEHYIRRRAIRHMEKGRIVIFAAGVGYPYFTTDTVSALRAAEMNCDVLLKATQVDGVYSSDPKIDTGASKYNQISYKKVIKEGLKVMDTAAITLAQDNNIPIIVFNIKEKGNLEKILQEKGNFTIINNDETN